MDKESILYTRDGDRRPDEQLTNSHCRASTELENSANDDKEKRCDETNTIHQQPIASYIPTILSQKKETKSFSSLVSPIPFNADRMLSNLGYSILTCTNEHQVEIDDFSAKSSISPFGPILAVHSNEYVEQRRSEIRQAARQMNDSMARWNPFYMAKEGVFSPKVKKTYFRPEWPFLHWKHRDSRSTIDPDVFLSEHDPYIDPHENTTSSEVRGDHVLRDILRCDPAEIDFDFVTFLFQESQTSAQTENCVENHRIVEEVRGIVQSTCEVLAKKHKIFQNFVIIEMGSMGEGTKIGDPNEFDFMIELPLLDKAVRAKLPWVFFRNDQEDDESRELVTTNRNLLDDFEDLKATTDNTNGEKTDQRDIPRKLWNFIQYELAEVMGTLTPPGWKWLDTAPPYMSGPALTQTLLWKGHRYTKLFVHLDICICFRPSYFDSKVDWNQDVLDKTRPGIWNPSTKKRIGMKPVYLILRSDGTARWTRALQEKQIWSIFQPEDGRKITYRCLKFAISKFMCLKYNDAQFRLDPTVPSYWIKTVLYYLMIVYHDNKHWTKDVLTTRFVEAFLLLKTCLTERVLSSFFVPRNLLSRVITNEELEPTLSRFLFLSDLLVKRQSQTTNEKCYKSTADRVQRENDKELQEGLFRSVIELCYFYAYNDFSEETYRALHSFVEIYIADDVRLTGEGSSTEMWYKGSRVDINEHINKQYQNDKRYFGTKQL